MSSSLLRNQLLRQPGYNAVAQRIYSVPPTIQAAWTRERGAMAKTRWSKPACNSLGMLDYLPPELLIEVLLTHAGALALVAFRQVNQCAMDFVASMGKYAAVMRHCPEVLRAFSLLHSRISSRRRGGTSHHDLGQLCRVLEPYLCDVCEESFGDYLDVRTWIRYCFRCSLRQFETLEVINFASSFYTKRGTQKRGRKTRHHHLHGEEDPSDVEAMPGCYCVACDREEGLQTDHFMVKKPFRPDQEQRPGKVVNMDRRTFFEAFDRLVADDYGMLIMVPTLSDHGRRAEWGYLCLGCEKDEAGRIKYQYLCKYTRDEYLDHLEAEGPVIEVPDQPGTFMHA
ncbi:hypothetical protein E4U41_004214 [Claviceps citrina]|nr:hypothetical protein E4U41_004214 [Claviceps citrina]